MIVGGAYQPMATRLIDRLAELEDGAGELLRVEDLTAASRDRLIAIRASCAVLGDALWRALRTKPDSTLTFRALIAADRLVTKYAKAVRECAVQREALPID